MYLLKEKVWETVVRELNSILIIHAYTKRDRSDTKVKISDHPARKEAEDIPIIFDISLLFKKKSIFDDANL